MGPIELNKRRIFILVAAIVAFFILFRGLGSSAIHYPDILPHVPIIDHPSYPKETKFKDDDLAWDYPKDLHPIHTLMEKADHAFRVYEGTVSTTFRQTVEKYRTKYGRHPPPNFAEWYRFSRKKGVFNIDDFEHIMDDLRPFWAIDPATIRSHAAHMWGDEGGHHAAGIHIRNHKIAKISEGTWGSEVMEQVINNFVSYLPDMDIPMNRQDQPRVLVPWEDMQALLQKEYQARAMPPGSTDSFTANQPGLLDLGTEAGEHNSTRVDAGWFNAPGQHYMKIASKACPPYSPARRNMSADAVNALYKEGLGGFVNNFNLSTDLCTVGPTIDNLHGMLYSASSMTATHTLVPMFSECKTSVNNDILFPANMYYKHDDRYDYDPTDDVDWRAKQDRVIWRGVTSGGVQTVDTWKTMHRQRLVQLFNRTQLLADGSQFAVLTQATREDSGGNITYTEYDHFRPSQFADDHSDVGFVESRGCIPNCSFYDTVFSMKNQTTLTSQFLSRYLVDVDGHSFSGRWHAFLQSKSLAFKATIFREWHDSRLFAWKHFIPVDNRYNDLYALLTYFVGYGQPSIEHALESQDPNPDVYIGRHEKEAQQIARQGREWANTVLRRDDIEVYMFRLLLEYGRIIDDNRDRIGYSADGSELDDFDNGQTAKSIWNLKDWLKGSGSGTSKTVDPAS
ncbi:hypothetical protein DV736_g301, partial [Chaetothyriales sp. CBS 134916]